MVTSYRKIFDRQPPIERKRALWVASACAESGQPQKACEYGDQDSCDALCKRNDLKACESASPDIKAAAEQRQEKLQAEASIPRLLARCTHDRTTILQWKAKLAAAEKSGDEPGQNEASNGLDQLQDAWGRLKSDLQAAVMISTDGKGPRFNELRARARLACAGNE